MTALGKFLIAYTVVVAASIYFLWIWGVVAIIVGVVVTMLLVLFLSCLPLKFRRSTR